MVTETDKVRKKCLNSVEVVTEVTPKKITSTSNLSTYIAYGIVAVLLIIASFAFLIWQLNWWSGKSRLKFTSENNSYLFFAKN